MENNISNLIHEREMINSRMERMIYGSIEIREKSNNRYTYVYRRIDETELHTRLFILRVRLFFIFIKKHKIIFIICICQIIFIKLYTLYINFNFFYANVIFYSII